MVPEHAVTRVGDLWILGPHRVLCGDATSAAVVERLFESASPALMVTDPPYGVEYDPGWRDQRRPGEPRQSGAVANDDKVDWTATPQLFRGDVAYVWRPPGCTRIGSGRRASGSRLPDSRNNYLGQATFRAESW